MGIIGLKAVSQKSTELKVPISELSNEKARELYKDKMKDIEAGKFDKTINDD